MNAGVMNAQKSSQHSPSEPQGSPEGRQLGSGVSEIDEETVDDVVIVVVVVVVVVVVGGGVPHGLG